MPVLPLLLGVLELGTVSPWQARGLDAPSLAAARRRQTSGRVPAGGLYGRPLSPGCRQMKPILWLPCRAFRLLLRCRVCCSLCLVENFKSFLARPSRAPRASAGKPAVAARFPGLGGTTTPPKGCFVLCAAPKNLKTAAKFPRCYAGKFTPVLKQNCVVVGISRYMVFCQKMEKAKNY